MKTVTDLAAGDTVAGYRIDVIIGRGGMGIVYLATQLSLQRQVALKVMLPEYASDSAFRSRFEREAKVAASLEHPHVLPIHETGEVDGLLFLCMRNVAGGDLATLLRTRGPIEPLRAARIVSQIGEALDAAHNHGLVHRDVKPSNILLETREAADHAYLADFGLARATASASALTRSGGFLGTVGYASPEQIQGQHVDARCDVYALGCLLYECLTGRRPFARETEVAMIWAHLRDAPPRPSEHDFKLARYDAVVARALAKTPEARYATAGELGRVAVNGEGTRASRGSLAGRADDTWHAVKARIRRPRVRRVLVGLTALILAIATGVLAGSKLVSRDVKPSGAGAVAGDAIPVGAAPSGVVVSEGVVWVPSERDGTVTRIEAGSRDVLGETARLDSGLGPITAGAGAIWPLNFQGWVGRVESATGQIANRRTVVPGAADVAFGEGAIWVLTTAPEGAAVVRVDPETQEVRAEVQGIGNDAVALAVGAGVVWVLTSSKVLRIDPETNALTGSAIQAGKGLVDIAADQAAVWVANAEDDTVYRIDPDSNEIVGLPTRVGHEPSALAIGEGAIWVVNEGDETVSRIDPATAAIIGDPIAVGGGPTAIATGSGSVWVTRTRDATIARIEPGEVVS